MKLNQPDWSPFSHSIAIGGELKSEGVSVHVILNAYWEPLDFELPILSGWQRDLAAVDRYCDWIRRMTFANGMRSHPFWEQRIGLRPRSVVVLIADQGRSWQTG